MEVLHRTWNAAVPVCRWSGITCDAEYKIVSIDWCARALKGTVQFEELPTSVKRIDLSDEDGHVYMYRMQAVNYNENLLQGNLPLYRLPNTLQTLRLTRNLFSGEVDLPHLPPQLEELYLAFNEFEGLVEFHDLPQSLRTVRLDGNKKLYGVIHRNLLPPALQSAWGITMTDTNIEYEIAPLDQLLDD